MPEPIIKVENLKKSFKIPEKSPDAKFSTRLKEVFIRRWKEIEVLKGLSFEIQRGEFVGYIGANGAGKSTTIKLLTGIIQADSGSISCAGFNPYSQRYAYTYNIGVVFGQKSILEYEVPVKASFELYRGIYEISKKDYLKRVDFFNEILSIHDYWDIPVRKLSFGMRMRCEIAASLLHSPAIVFMDEPTIGLDASAKKEIRHFLKAINREEKTTIVLTTHDMKDIESLCQGVILIDEGRLIYDGGLPELRQSFLNESTLHFRVKEIYDHEKFYKLRDQARHTESQDGREIWSLPLEGQQIGTYLRELIVCADFQDFHVGEPELEEVIHHIYQDQNKSKV